MGGGEGAVAVLDRPAGSRAPMPPRPPRLTGVELLQVVQDLRQLVAALDVPADEAQRAAGSRWC